MIEWIITSCILISAVIILRFIFRGKISLLLQYALWILVLARLLIPINFGSSGLSAGNLIAAAEKQPAAQTIYELGHRNVSARSFDGAYEQVIDEYRSRGVDISLLEGSELESLDGEAYDFIGKFNIFEFVKSIALYLWITGIFAVGLVFVISSLYFSRRAKKSRRLLGYSGKLPIYVTENVDTPCLFGLFHPVIYVTPQAVENKKILRHTTEHETTHFRHGDHIWSILRGICVALHWYNPLVWKAAFLSQRDGELACDEATIRRLGEEERADYGRTLIFMTCQKRISLFMSAATMTGSKRSIKERITMIANKPKMSVYTLAAVILIAAAVTGCAFTGVKDTPWRWAQVLNPDDIISAVPWNDNNDMEILSSDEIETFTSLMNGLNKSDFAENKQLVGGTPEYGLRLQTPGGNYNINQSIAPYGALEIKYAGKQWWIDNDELTAFVKRVTSQENIDFEISSDVSEDIPSAVVEYAKAYVRKEIAGHNEYGANPSGGAGNYSIIDARITKLESMNTGVAALNEGIGMYRLEYRLLPDRPENVMLSSRIKMEDGWITEWSSAGQIYLLLYYNETGGEMSWRGIGAAYTESIEQEYGTPEMLAQYGNAYTAASVELGRKYMDNHVSEA